MYLNVTCVDHQPLEVRLVDQLLEQRFPYPLVAPATETPMGVLPVAVVGRQVAPRRARAEDPKDSIDEFAIIMPYAAPRAFATG
jgi:hypothetical protein